MLNRGEVSGSKLSHFRLDDSLETIITKVLDAPDTDHWDALRAVLGIQHKQELCLIIDGLDKVEQEDGFIKDVRVFIEQLQETSTIKALLTSRPLAKFKVILDGLSCIEYDKERKECLNALRFDNTRSKMITEEHKGSLEWLWEHRQYQTWSSAEGSELLLIEGKPGSGKSTLMKYFERNLLVREPLAREAIVASFFYSYREGELQTNHSNMLRSILYSVLDQEESFFFHFQSSYRNVIQSGKQFQWPYNSLKEILLSLREHPVKEQLYFVVDAMDESDDADRWNVIQLLRQLCSTDLKTHCKVKTVLASRPITGLNHPAESLVIRLQDENDTDILKFARSFLGPELQLPSDILHQALDFIVKHAQGVFVWVHLVKQELLVYARHGVTKKQIFDFLRGIPTELEEFYTRILNGLANRSKRDLKDGQKMFRLVLFAYRPLALSEFHQALAIPDDDLAEFSPSDQAFEDELLLGINQRIIHCGRNFLEVKGVSENHSVQVMHQTVREFFLRPDSPVAQSEFRMIYEDAHARIATTCLRYLMLCSANTSVQNKLPSIESWTSEHFTIYTKHLKERPFIDYVLSHLKHHMDSC
ncbi:hypothetical protein K440DRAFT_566563, partial [Wilcoxina mikolae CBS 423.85]